MKNRLSQKLNTLDLKLLDKLFWFRKNRAAGLDVERDKTIIIHQTLALGSLKDVKNLFAFYGKDVIRKEFRKPAKGIYHPAVLALFEYILGVKVDKSQYIKNIYGKLAS